MRDRPISRRHEREYPWKRLLRGQTSTAFRARVEQYRYSWAGRVWAGPMTACPSARQAAGCRSQTEVATAHPLCRAGTCSERIRVWKRAAGPRRHGAALDGDGGEVEDGQRALLREEHQDGSVGAEERQAHLGEGRRERRRAERGHTRRYAEVRRRTAGAFPSDNPPTRAATSQSPAPCPDGFA